MLSLDEHVTIIVPTSPIPSHPSTELIDECVKAIDGCLPEAKLVVLADGIRDEVSQRSESYQGYLKNLEDGEGVTARRMDVFKSFETHEHQTRMLRWALTNEVETPLVLFVEHDTILRADPKIEWERIFDLLLHDKVDVVRFYNWEKAPWHEHEYLMRGNFIYEDVNFLRTVQFSGWPFIASSDYLRRLVASVPEESRTMLEPAVYKQVANGPWEENRIVIYAPENAQTFYHRDGRLDSETGSKDPGGW